MQVRNLNYLNRDLDKVLLITANPDAYALQPDNAIKVRNGILI
jgi:import inner membrane translocase subunit TIM50